VLGWGLTVDVRLLEVLAAMLVGEAIVLGWERSSLRRIVTLRSTSTRRDVLLYGAQIVRVMPFLTSALTFGAAYVTGLFANALLVSMLFVDIRVRTGSFALDAALFVVAFSFVEYWDHRILHSKVFWRLHRLHHTATELNMLTSGRNHPALFAFEPLLRVWVAGLLATPPEFLVFWSVFHHAHQLLSHSMVGWDFGWFGRWVVVSPVAHRIHHSRKPEHHNKNFSNFLTIWDRIFGTWCEPSAPLPEVGLDEDLATSTSNPSLWRECVADVKRFAHDLHDALRVATRTITDDATAKTPDARREDAAR
jgi:sterol desaturase/sphingolipid hydroxylase (fatty acid hydroxylase superfamily)